MTIPENLLDYVKSEAEKVHHGRIIIELNKTSDKIDVIIESRERFNKEGEGVVRKERQTRQG